MIRSSPRSAALAHVGLALAAAYILFVLIASVSPDALSIALLGSGVAVACYGSIIFMARGSGLRVVLTVIAIALAGLSHVAWILVLTAALQSIISWSRATFPSELAGMYLATGVVFGLVIAIASRSWLALVINFASAISAALCTLLEPRFLNLALGLGCAMLHLGIASSLYIDTLRHLRRQHRPGICPNCDYELAGLSIAPGAKCPECGHARRDAPQSLY